MKKRTLLVLFALLLILTVGCVKEKNGEYPNIQVDGKKIECEYIEPTLGGVETFNFSFEDTILEDVLNAWIIEIANTGVSYGRTSNRENILDELKVVDAYLEGADIVIVMNDAFKAFESSDSNDYTHPEYFFFGFMDIVSKVTDAESMTIDYNGKTSEVIHPEGFVIDNLTLKD